MQVQDHGNSEHDDANKTYNFLYNTKKYELSHNPMPNYAFKLEHNTVYFDANTNFKSFFFYF
jgi:hypothetical protein